MVEFRCANVNDTDKILYFIKTLAEYENMADKVVCDESLLKKTIFEKNGAEVLFILDEYRGKGYGKALFRKLAQTAKEREYGRIEWWCLDWNKPSIDFYKSMGAEAMEDWTVYRISGDTLNKLAE